MYIPSLNRHTVKCNEPGKEQVKTSRYFLMPSIVCLAIMVGWWNVPTAPVYMNQLQSNYVLSYLLPDDHIFYPPLDYCPLWPGEFDIVDVMCDSGLTPAKQL